MQRVGGILGLSAVFLFVTALLTFGNLNPAFDFLEDFVSKLGARGAPHALWWNLIGFLLVGVLLIGFGLSYGKILEDRFAGILLALFGVGFACTAIPVDFEAEHTPVSKAHIAAICLSLAFWLFGLARISYNPRFSKKIHVRANIAAVLIVVSMIGAVADLWSEPFAHRLVFLTVFGWTGITSMELINKSDDKPE